MKTFTTPSKHDPDGIDIDNNFEDTMTTEEKKCPKCKKGVNSEPDGGNENCFHCSDCGYIECGEEATPPETGRGWEDSFYERYELPEVASDAVLSDMKRFIRFLVATARAEGAKAERERIRKKIVAYATEGRFDADEIKGLSLYSKIIRYFDALKGKHHE